MNLRSIYIINQTVISFFEYLKTKNVNFDFFPINYSNIFLDSITFDNRHYAKFCF